MHLVVDSRTVVCNCACDSSVCLFVFLCSQVLALLVASHYKNTPNDLLLLADAPAHQLYVLLGPVDETQNALPDVLAVVQVTGLLADASCSNITSCQQMADATHGMQLDPNVLSKLLDLTAYPGMLPRLRHRYAEIIVHMCMLLSTLCRWLLRELSTASWQLAAWLVVNCHKATSYPGPLDSSIRYVIRTPGTMSSLCDSDAARGSTGTYT